MKEFHLALLLLQTAMLGALASLDVLLFYVFFEAMLIPMYLLIGRVGLARSGTMAAMKFFLYTLVGSLLMLVAILARVLPRPARRARAASTTRRIYNALAPAQPRAGGLRRRQGGELRLALAAGAGAAHLRPVDVPGLRAGVRDQGADVPGAHLAAGRARAGAGGGLDDPRRRDAEDGDLRLLALRHPAVPGGGAADAACPSRCSAVVGIVYGALMCLAQRDIKKLIAYSSVSHLGFCMLGIFALTAEGATGSAYQMLNHGVSTGALFLLFGILYERRHTRLISDYGGIAKVMPVFTALVPDHHLLLASRCPAPTASSASSWCCSGRSSQPPADVVRRARRPPGVILGAAYMLWMVQRVFFGPLAQRREPAPPGPELRELATALPFVVLVLVMGLLPQPFLDRLRAVHAERFMARAPGGPRAHRARPARRGSCRCPGRRVLDAPPSLRAGWPPCRPRPPTARR